MIYLQSCSMDPRDLRSKTFFLLFLESNFICRKIPVGQEKSLLTPEQAGPRIVYHWTPSTNFKSIIDTNLQVPDQKTHLWIKLMMVTMELVSTHRLVSRNSKCMRKEKEDAFCVWAYRDVSAVQLSKKIELVPAGQTMRHTPLRMARSGSFSHQINFCHAFWSIHSFKRSPRHCRLYSH